MTVREAIALVDRLKPNKFSEADKVKWLSDIDGLIVRELVDSHEDRPFEGEFLGYANLAADGDKELIAPYPYDILYRWYLESQIDLGNAEIGKYNNSKTLFNSAYLTYTDHYNRTHMPKRRVQGFRFTEARSTGGEKDALSS